MDAESEIVKTIPLRHLAAINPPAPAFSALSADSEVQFLPLDAVWHDGRADHSRRVRKESVAAGYTRFEAGDIVCPKVSPTFAAGRSMIVNQAGAGTTELHTLRAGPGADPRFICYVLRSARFLQEGVTAYEGVAGLRRVSGEFVAEYRVRAVTLGEQRRIADFLDEELVRIDRTISARQAQLTRIEGLRLSRLRSLTTIGDSGQSAVRTGIDWMPVIASEWDLPRVAQVFRTGSGTTPPTSVDSYYNGDVPWINTRDVNDGPITSTVNTVAEGALKTFPALTLYDAGSLVVAMYGQGATKGRVGITKMPACANQACCVLTSSNADLIEWAFYWFRAHKAEVIGLALGAGQPNLSQEIVRGLRLPLPGPSEISKLVKTIRSEEHEWNGVSQRLAASNTLLAEYKTSLISAAVTGELDVTTASREIVV